MPEVHLADAELYYTEVGEGVTVVLVHGGLADYRLWGRLSSILSKKFRVISYSRRGAYPNKIAKEEETSVSIHSADLSSLISQISRAPVHLVAESYGACVATLCALRNPHQVLSMVIDEPPILSLLRSDESDLAELNRFEKVLRAAIDNYASGRSVDAARSIVDFLEGSPGVYDSLPQEVKAAIEDDSTASFADLKGGLESITPADLQELRVSTLLLKSELGPSLLKRVVDRFSALVPRCQVDVIKGTTHGSIVDSPVYSDVVLDFLTRA